MMLLNYVLILVKALELPSGIQIQGHSYYPQQKYTCPATATITVTLAHKQYPKQIIFFTTVPYDVCGKLINT